MQPLHATNELLFLSELLVDYVALSAYSREDSHYLEVQVVVVSLELFENAHGPLLELFMFDLTQVFDQVDLLTAL